MNFGICPLSIVPVRTSSSHKSEMCSQLLFGELFEILDRKGRQWVKIRCLWDNFVGWVSAHQIAYLTPDEYERYQIRFAYNLELMQAARADDYFLPITMGAQLPNFDGLRFEIGGKYFTYSGQTISPEKTKIRSEFIIKMARRFLHTPYLWGGRSPFGVDHDGFVQLIYKLAGFALPREAAEQIYIGQNVYFTEQAQAGDIAFFQDRNGKINHTGIILPEQEIIHAYGKVRIDKIDHYGVFNKDYNRYTHRLRLIKRLLPSETPAQPLPVQKSEPANKQVELFPEN